MQDLIDNPSLVDLNPNKAPIKGLMILNSKVRVATPIKSKIKIWDTAQLKNTFYETRDEFMSKSSCETTVKNHKLMVDSI